MGTAATVCPLDCPDRCSLVVSVENGRVTGIEGSRVNPVTDGFICSKVRRFGERVHGPDRVLYPRRRVGRKGEGRFERVGWDEALDIVAARIRAVRAAEGGGAILPFSYGGSNGLLTQGGADERLFRSLGAARLARTVCAAQTGLAAQALYGKMASVDFPDFAAARLVLIWGANPKHSNVHLMPYLKAVRARGGRVVLVDPRRSLGEGFVDAHLAVRPGTDLAVALAMIACLERNGAVDERFLAAHATGADRLLARAREWPLERAAEVAGVAARDIAALADAYAEADPALVRCGWGVERNRNGEAAVAAILALPALAGKFGRPGGGYAMSSSEAYGVDADRLAGVSEPETPVVNMSRLGRVLLEGSPRIRLLFVYDANPAVTLPDQGRVTEALRSEELFTVVFDPVMTDTAAFADIVLPGTTFLEHAELSTSYGTYSVMLGEPVIPPQGESKPNEEVFRLLGERLGVGGFATGDAAIEGALAAIDGPLAGAGGGRDRLERLRRDGRLAFAFPGERPIQFGTVFPNTPDRRIRLWPDELGPEPYRFLPEPDDPQHPLALISPSTERSVCSTLSEYGFREAWVELHPDDAASRGLREGQEVRVFNTLGELRVPLRLNPSLRAGVALVPKGTWRRHSRNGACGTVLVPDFVSPLSGGACFNDARVEVGAA
ncbi:MAG TPA: molybdopterin-dependent oxidoreductase [Vicinamibacteria bacterium]|nr:molybdopterin-dependent oxidoreductase [Vicinamibacteria bacterium]